MGTPENEQLLQRIFDALSQGDSRPFADAMADGFTWTVTGTTAWSRRYEGKAAVQGELLAPLRARIEGRIRVAARRILACGDWVVVEARGDAVTREGRRYDNEYCFVIRVEAGELRELVEYLDTELVTAALGEPPWAARHA